MFVALGVVREQGARASCRLLRKFDDGPDVVQVRVVAEAGEATNRQKMRIIIVRVRYVHPHPK